MSFKYQLDQSSKKFICPGCQKKRLVRYINVQTGQYCDDVFGRCDREVNCGYNRVPGGEIIVSDFIPRKKKSPFIVSVDLFKRTLTNYSNNNLFLFINKLFGENKTMQVFALYRVGTSKWRTGATIFWQINSKGQIGQGKIMVFDKDSGKRVKNPLPLISSVHAQLKKQDEKPEYGFFGEHLINQYSNKPLAIVEGEKTALIMTIIQSDCLWIASGGLSQLNERRMQVYKNRTIVFYPDLGAFQKWEEKATKLNKQGYTIKVSTLLENKAPEHDKKEGFDIADYFIQKRIVDLQPMKNVEIMTQKNSDLQKLIDTLNLVPVR